LTHIKTVIGAELVCPIPEENSFIRVISPSRFLWNGQGFLFVLRKWGERPHYAFVLFILILICTDVFQSVQSSVCNKITM